MNNCDTCKHRALGDYVQPCYACLCKSNITARFPYFEPKEKEQTMTKLERIAQIENSIQGAQAELAQLKKEVEEENKPKCEFFVDEPKHGEQYWFISSSEINSLVWDGDEIDNRKLNSTILYRTEEACEKALERQQARTYIVRYIARINGDNVPTFEKGDAKWRCYYDHQKIALIVDFNKYMQKVDTELYLNRPYTEEERTHITPYYMKMWGIE